MTQEHASAILLGVSEGSKITELNIGMNDSLGLDIGLLEIEVYLT